MMLESDIREAGKDWWANNNDKIEVRDKEMRYLVVVLIILALTIPARANLTQERQQAMLDAIKTEDIELMGKLLDTQELSLNMVVQGRNWIEIAANNCVPKSAEYLVERNIEWVGRESSFWSLISRGNDKCQETAEVLANAYDFSHSYERQYSGSTMDGECYINGGKAWDFLMRHYGISDFHDESGHNILHRAMLTMHTEDCYDQLVELFKPRDWPADPPDPMGQLHPKPWHGVSEVVLQMVKEPDAYGVLPSDLVQGCLWDKPYARRYYPFLTKALNVLMLHGAPADSPHKMSPAQCTQEWNHQSQR